MSTIQNIAVPSYRVLALILGALLVLTAVTVAVSRVPLGSLHVVLPLLIAALKGSLVIWFFMNMRQEPKLVRIGLLVTIVLLAVFIGLMFFDLSFR